MSLQTGVCYTRGAAEAPVAGQEKRTPVSPLMPAQQAPPAPSVAIELAAATMPFWQRREPSFCASAAEYAWFE